MKIKIIKISLISILSLFLFACSSDEKYVSPNPFDLNVIDTGDLDDHWIDVEESYKVIDKEDKSDDENYDVDVRNYVEKLSSYVYDLIELHDEFSQNNDLANDKEWTHFVQASLESINITSENIKELNPPTSSRTSHRYIIKALDEYEYVVDNYIESAKSLDIEDINLCIDSLDKGTDYLYDNWID